jgi:hypothetical protein
MATLICQNNNLWTMNWCDAPLIILCWVSMSQFFHPLLFLWSLLLVTWTCLWLALQHLQIVSNLHFQIWFSYINWHECPSLLFCAKNWHINLLY